MARPFLTARWTDLLLVTWGVPDDLLAPYLPAGLELDRWEGQALASIVAFDFEDTRVLGTRWPGLVRFPETNLRFYVRRHEQRGVCFVNEFVRSSVIAAAARLLYNEPYRAVPYSRQGGAHVLVAGGRTHRIAWVRLGALHTPPEESLSHFLKEHSWGFGRRRNGRTSVYEVRHPPWRVWPEVRPDLEIDAGVLLGPRFASLASSRPLSVIAAEGSEVEVYPSGALDPRRG